MYVREREQNKITFYVTAQQLFESMGSYVYHLE